MKNFFFPVARLQDFIIMNRKLSRYGRELLIAVVCLVVGSSVLTARAFSSADADTIFAAHTKAFFRSANGGAYYLKRTEGNRPADFWTEAEQLEMVLDHYERSTNAHALVMFTNVFRGFLTEHGRSWA